MESLYRREGKAKSQNRRSNSLAYLFWLWNLKNLTRIEDAFRIEKLFNAAH
jgi:hypothetical protein